MKNNNCFSSCEDRMKILKNDVSYIGERIVVKEDIGGYSAGEVIMANTPITAILKKLLAGKGSSVSTTVYYGASVTVPTSVSGLVAVEVTTDITASGFSAYFVAEREHELFAYDKSLGELKHIYQNDLPFDLINNYNRSIILVDGVEYYLYSTKDKLLEDSKYEFLWA